MPDIDIQKQKPWKTNQIDNDRPNAPSTESVLSGYIAGGMNGGHDTVIGWKEIMAGEKHRQMRGKICFQMLTPLTPAYQNLKMTVRTYFVPHSRVWKNAEKFQAQKGGASETKIDSVPFTRGNNTIPTIQSTTGEYTNLVNTTVWRDTFIGQYYPRIGPLGFVGQNAIGEPQEEITLPPLNALLLRGRIAIYNDMERNKEYDQEYPEFNEDTISAIEWSNYLSMNRAHNQGIDNDLFNINLMRAKKDNSYYSNYRTEMQGFTSKQEYNPNESATSLIEWTQWENLISEARAQSMNSQKTDWQIIAEIRGSKLLSEGKVQLIGQKTFNMNYSAITQNAYNNNQEISEEFRVMGKQGAYSYTEVEIPLYAGFEFNEDGYIHVIATCSADTVYDSAIDRTLMNVYALDRYRPDLKDMKQDVLYKGELGTNGRNHVTNPENLKQVIGFKRKFSEYFKLPNVISGDMVTNNWLEVNAELDPINEKYVISAGQTPEEIITQKTFQFFQNDSERWTDYETQESYWLDTWKDYTDLLINRNQAIKNEIMLIRNEGTSGLRIKGNQQIIFVGVLNCIADLPMDEDIKKDFIRWGEH